MKHWFRIYGIWNCATASLSRSDEADLPPTERLNALYDLPIRTDTEPDLDIAFALAERHGLSFYDAIYLELAAVSIGRCNTSIKSLCRCLEPQCFARPQAPHLTAWSIRWMASRSCSSPVSNFAMPMAPRAWPSMSSLINFVLKVPHPPARGRV